jgi:transposase-like protein
MDTNQTAEVIRLEDYRPGKSPAPKTPRKTKPLAERLAANVDTSAGPDACHPWTGSVMQANGYGQISAISPKTGRRTMRNTHVVAFELAHGPVPAGKRVLHARGCCKTCCNPAHLRAGTQAENMEDAKAERRLGRRLTKAEVLEIVMLHQRDGVSAAALAHRFHVDPATTRKILRGETWGTLTGIERHRLVGGRPRKAAPAPTNSQIIVPPKAKRSRQPEASFTEQKGMLL